MERMKAAEYLSLQSSLGEKGSALLQPLCTQDFQQPIFASEQEATSIVQIIISKAAEILKLKKFEKNPLALSSMIRLFQGPVD